jgi:ABC-type glycerol-3-phosphate transport system substrate-binding protein
MKSKKFIATTATVALAAGLVGCSAPQAEPNGDEITVAAQAWMITKLELDKVAENFEAANPGKKVTLVEYADNQTLSNFALQWSQGKSNQDVVITDGASTAVQFLARDLIIDFNETDFFEGATAKDKFIGDALAFSELDGVQYAIPLANEVYGINANKKYFEAAGLTDSSGEIIRPETWEDILDYAEKLTERNGDQVTRPGMMIQWGSNGLNAMLATSQAARGTMFGADGATITFDTPEMREILEIWREGVAEGVFSTATFTDKNAGQNAFNAGELPMLLQSAAHVAEATPTIGEENARFIPIPGSSENGARAGSAGIIIPKAAPNQELALQFIKEGLMSDVQIGVGAQWGKLPVLTDFFEQIDAPWRDEILAVMSVSQPTPMYKDLPKLQVSVVRELQPYLTGDKSLDDFLKAVEQQIADADKQVN